MFALPNAITMLRILLVPVFAIAFVMPGDAARKGYHTVFWKQGDIDLAAVSDTAPAELADFVALVKKSP